MALSLWAPAQAQDLQYAPPGLLTLDSRADLSILAEHLALTPTALFVSGQNRAGGQVMKLSPADLALLVQVEAVGIRAGQQILHLKVHLYLHQEG